jgi:ubiquinone/menaquinone biosynthesis C-methylase UbiE
MTQMSNRIGRSLQEMMWAETVATLREREAEYLADLDAADRRGPGSVQYDPNFRYPGYFDPIDFHIQPGSYHRDPLAGHIYHLGTKFFLQGANDDDQLQRGLVSAVPLPEDGQVRRVLDLACSCGQCTTAFKERFPSAEVWGVDVSAPMARYAHKRAADMGLDVHFKQALAEDTGFPAGSFDLVFANIMFHELPEEISAAAIREAHRILRPGGVFCFVDIRDKSQLSTDGLDVPLAQYQHFMQGQTNGEVYHTAFHHTDFVGLMQAAGFHAIENDHQGMGWHPGLVMPMRVAIR